MSVATDCDRRTFLARAGAVGLALAGLGACSGDGGDEPVSETTPTGVDPEVDTATEALEARVELTSSPFLEAYFGDVATAALIGAAHLADVEEGAAERLAIDDAIRATAMGDDASEASVAAMRDQVQTDFAENRMVSVAGWRLAPTEVQLGLVAAGA